MAGFLSRLLRLWLCDAAGALFICGILVLWRGGLVVCFFNTLSPLPAADEWGAMVMRALQFDAKASAFLILPLLVCSVMGVIFKGRLQALFLRLKGIYIGGVVTLTHVLGFVTLCFFQEYHAPFNGWVMGLFYDDIEAILWTVWQTYPVVWGALGLVFVSYLSCRWVMYALLGLEKWLERFFCRASWKSLGGVSILFFIALVSALRGTWGHMPLKPLHVGVTANTSLNAFVLNPYMALYFVAKEDALRKGAGGLESFWPSGDAREAFQYLYGKECDEDNGVGALLLCVAKGPKVKSKPRHIFLVVMESQDVWPMLAPYDVLDLNPCLSALKLKGQSVEPFLSAGWGTMPSLAALIAGLHDADLNINYQPRSRQPYATSLAPLFKALGYKTRFIYGGYLSWQKVGEFCQGQGFDDVIGGGVMGKLAGTDWGVEDTVLFDYILSHTPDDIPTFNVIMTSTNHPPYPLTEARLKEIGWTKTEMPEALEGIYDGEVSLRILGHTFYADWAVGDFVKRAEKQWQDAFFVITGDHNSRKFLNATPRLYERRAVPCIFYGPAILGNVVLPKNAAGDHLDIAPTLIELIAPEGFRYATMGKDLFDPLAPQIGYGTDFIITPSFIADDKDGLPQSVFAGNAVADVERLPDYRKRYNALRALSWWQIFGGNQ